MYSENISEGTSSPNRKHVSSHSKQNTWSTGMVKLNQLEKGSCIIRSKTNYCFPLRLTSNSRCHSSFQYFNESVGSTACTQAHQVTRANDQGQQFVFYGFTMCRHVFELVLTTGNILYTVQRTFLHQIEFEQQYIPNQGPGKRRLLSNTKCAMLKFTRHVNYYNVLRKKIKFCKG